MNDARQAFGLTLRTQREQLGITLPDIAESTKISAALLSALERGDVSRWPKGIFRRAFFREYVGAIGMTPEPLLAEFVRLFPDEAAPSTVETGDFRLALAPKESSAAVALRRAAVVMAEVAVLAVIGAAGAWLVNGETVSAIGLAALIYYPATNLCVDRRLGLRSLRTRVKSPLPVGEREPRRYDEIEGHEELQVSF